MIGEGRIDWNDSVGEFIIVKIKRPEVLAELIRREKQYTEKWSCEKKIEDERNQYEKLAAAFRSDQQQFELNMTKKRNLQKQISRLQNEVVRMQFDLIKLEGQEKFLSKTKLSEKGSSQCLNLRNNESINQSELESMMAQYGLFKNILNRELQELVARRVQLKEDLTNIKVQHDKLNEEFNLESQLVQVEQEVIKMEKQLKKQRKLKTELMEIKKSADLSYLMDKKNREATRSKVEQNSQRLRDFGKDSKKILIGNDGIDSKKYQQFVKKYKTNSRQDQIRLKNKLASLKQNEDNPYNKQIFREVDNRLQKLKETITGIMNSSNKQLFTASQFQELKGKCQDITRREKELQQMEPLLQNQVQVLSKNLQRKTRQLQIQMAKLNLKRS